MELATTFKCNVSQLSKALIGVEYLSGPHYYKPRPKSVKKHTSELGEPSGMPPTKTSKPVAETTAKPAQTEHLLAADDTLETDSSSSDLPPGL